MSTLLERPPPPQPPAASAGNGVASAGAPLRTAAPRPDSLPLRLAAFAALALMGAAHWAGLVEGSPAWRVLALVVIATAGATALALLRAVPAARARFPLAGVVALVTLLAGFVAAGLEARLLPPGNWGELADGVDRGLAGVRSVSWPYGGNDEWVGQAILLGAPLMLGLAAALAFWPARRGTGLLRGAGLVALLLLYGTAVTEHDPGLPVLRGLLLLALVAAWLWLPRLAPREAATGAAAVLAAGVVAIPLSARLDADQPWWDYRAWNWFGGGKAVTFDWRHSYGPLDWPREGTTLLNIRSSKPHYWKTQTLDVFDGFRWVRRGARTNVERTRRAYGELPSSPEPEGPTWDYFEYNPRWDAQIRVTVRALRSDLIVGAGTSYRVFGAGLTDTASDGTTVKLDEPLEKGDVYGVRSYAPTPTPAQMRGAPDEYAESLSSYAAVFLPNAGETAIEDEAAGGLDSSGSRLARRRAVFPPLRNSFVGDSGDAARELADSPYAGVHRLARRVTAGSTTAYDAVRAIESHLKRNYRYNERPPTQEVPLAAFLFEDKIGYCQQFSGAMALMLRMVGIPARVATGFTRGSFNRETREYRVRDLDAHSWVEVHFTGIGWVAFDPTPAAAPAEGQAPSFGPAGSALTAPGDQGRDAPGADRTGDPGAAASPSDGGADWRAAALLVLLSAGGAALWLRRSRRRGDRSARDRAEAQLAELRAALTRLGWALPGGTTLLELERRLERVAGPKAARYAASLRAHRYDSQPPGPPGPGERRALRRELGAVGGLRTRLRALVALPPGRLGRF